MIGRQLYQCSRPHPEPVVEYVVAVDSGFPALARQIHTERRQDSPRIPYRCIGIGSGHIRQLEMTHSLCEQAKLLIVTDWALH